MSPAVIGLALFAALLHATWNAFLRGGADRLWTVTVMSMSGTAVAIPFLFLLPLPAPAAWPAIALSSLLQTGYSLFLVAAYRRGELGQVYPIVRGSVPLLVTLGGLAFAGEAVGLWQMAGVLLVTAGIMTLSSGKGRADPMSVLLALATGVFIASYVMVDAIGVRLSGHSGAYTVWVLVGYGTLLPVVVAVARGGLAVDLQQRETWTALGGGLAAALAYGAVIAAFYLGPTGPIAALRETSVIFAILIGRMFLGETLTLRRGIACVVVATGAILLGL
ncbi:EamA family transporter [Methylobrevis pamukkalensis]|uniref:EamA-like transporter family protein n=1 Tax=Methylobrevis pamukkalensis TaxID=1439726 RepID=A0A1E3H3K6_9HYPH|nr:EamA family transporter [Methylobrevis pamukkalensis]ODN70121.1 EamA-like transporter family protein [Methylobrevis pamukkalensis]